MGIFIILFLPDVSRGAIHSFAIHVDGVIILSMVLLNCVNRPSPPEGVKYSIVIDFITCATGSKFTE